MTNEQIYKLGQLYRALSDAVRPNGASQADMQRAMWHPLREISYMVTLAHKTHKMTASLDLMASSVLSDVSLDDMQADFEDKVQPIPEQGAFQLGYMAGSESIDTLPRGIKAARTSAGFTVRELAEKIGVSPTTITMIESGRRVPRADTLRKIADLCQVSMDDLWPKV